MEELLKKQNEIIKDIESRYAEENYTESNPV